MGAAHILAAVALAFVIAATARLVRDGGKLNPQSRTWLLIAAIFTAVSIWLLVGS